MLLTACGEYLTELFLDIWSVARFTFWPVGELPPHDRVRATAATLLSVSEPLAPLLPVELEDMIVEGLRNDLQALRTCSLVCKDWNSTARRYLFRTLRVSGAKSETLPLLLLSAPDSIRMNVQTLVFSGAGLDMDYFVSLRGLMQLIASLPKLRDVEIYEPPPFRMDPGVTIDTPHRQSLRRLKRGGG
ncbi:hypothetical protein C8T65DRAFT_678880 [Cerioporus squamosus]|nr:hypothetical protein C8T65DRAFT_678880 [Cerioporus squamosus]